MRALNGEAIILDVRTLLEFQGLQHKAGAAKPGRLPAAKHLDWVNCVNYDGDGKFKSRAELHEIFQDNGLSENDKVIIYCHSGVRSSLMYLVLAELMSFQNVYNYDGSWVEWSHLDLPYEVDGVENL